MHDQKNSPLKVIYYRQGQDRILDWCFMALPLCAVVASLVEDSKKKKQGEGSTGPYARTIKHMSSLLLSVLLITSWGKWGCINVHKASSLAKLWKILHNKIHFQRENNTTNN